MHERRTKRSEMPIEALQYLVEAMVDRSDARAVALIDGRGRIVAGVGAPSVLRDLSSLGGEPDRATRDPRFARVTEGTDWFACEVPSARALWIVALGDRIRRLQDGAKAAARILGAGELAIA